MSSSTAVPSPWAADHFLQGLRLQRVSATTTAAYTRDLNQVALKLAKHKGLNAIEELNLASVSVQHLRDAFDTDGQTRVATSVARAHAYWTRFLTDLAQDGALDASPMAGIPKPKIPKRLPKPLRVDGALEAILQAANHPPASARQAWPTRDVAFTLLLGGAGLRSAETRALRVRDLMDSPDG